LKPWSDRKVARERKGMMIVVCERNDKRERGAGLLKRRVKETWDGGL